MWCFQLLKMPPFTQVKGKVMDPVDPATKNPGFLTSLNSSCCASSSYQLLLDTFPFINKAKSWILGTTQTGCNRRLSGSVDRVLQLTILAFQQWAHETRGVAEANLGHHLGSEPANHQAPLDEDLMQ